MKLLYVFGDGDYSALDFERSTITLKEAYAKATAAGGRATIELEDDEVTAVAYEFGEVDPKFIDFMTDNFVDYDVSKAQNFYIIEKESIE